MAIVKRLYKLYLLPVLLVPRLGLAQPRPVVLPIEPVAQKVAAIQKALAGDKFDGASDFKLYAARHDRQLELLKETVSSFVISRLGADPHIDPWRLRAEVAEVLGIQFNPAAPDHVHEPPYVFQSLRIDRDAPFVWALVYSQNAYEGSGGERTVVESYVVENGKARLAGRAGGERDGYVLNAEKIWNPLPNSISILVYGIYAWSSGHELPAAAHVFSISPSGVRTIWSFGGPGFRLIGVSDALFAFRYHDEQRHQQNLPSDVVDVYAVTKSEIPFRAAHQVLDIQ